MKKIIYVINVDWFFLSHRLPLAIHALERGYQVYLLALDTGKRSQVESLGIKFIEIPFKRSGTNPLNEFFCIYKLLKNYSRIKPDIVHHVTLKASLLGCIAAKLSGCTSVVNAISGFGYMFTNNRNGVKKAILKILLKVAFTNNTFSFILQNPDDLKSIKGMNVTREDRIFLIKGSGVNLKQFNYSIPPKKRKLEILFPARILRDKGVVEFLEAANLLEEKYSNKVRFVLAGDCDIENPTALTESELESYLKDEYIEWVGFQRDMIPIYKLSDIVVLPSYREGLPKSLIEACAIGRPVITTDAIGCRECVVNGVNGILVPIKKSTELANAIETLILDDNKRLEYGIASRTLAEREFSIENVVKSTFEIYDTYLIAPEEKTQ
jgi:glycosyltransferase involved in cell wall biosynthesis